MPIEIKSSRTYHETFLKNLNYYHKISSGSEKGILVYDGDLEFERDNIRVRNFRSIF